MAGTFDPNLSYAGGSAFFDESGKKQSDISTQSSAQISDQLFQAIDTIIMQRIKDLPFDRTVEGIITNDAEAIFGRYTVETGKGVNILAFSDNHTYTSGMKVLVLIPGGNFSSKKVIICQSQLLNYTTRDTSVEIFPYTANNEAELIVNEYQHKIEKIISEIADLREEAINNPPELIAALNQEQTIYDTIADKYQMIKEYQNQIKEIMADTETSIETNLVDRYIHTQELIGLEEADIDEQNKTSKQIFDDLTDYYQQYMQNNGMERVVDPTLDSTQQYYMKYQNEFYEVGTRISKFYTYIGYLIGYRLIEIQENFYNQILGGAEEQQLPYYDIINRRIVKDEFGRTMYINDTYRTRINAMISGECTDLETWQYFKNQHILYQVYLSDSDDMQNYRESFLYFIYNPINKKKIIQIDPYSIDDITYETQWDYLYKRNNLYIKREKGEQE